MAAAAAMVIPKCKTCGLRDCYKKPDGTFHPFCGKTCANTAVSQKTNGAVSSSASASAHSIIPKCTFCQTTNCSQKLDGSYHPFCSKTCADFKLNPQQGQPLCYICKQAAYYDFTTKKFSPGCGKTHAQLAISKGLFHPL